MCIRDSSKPTAPPKCRFCSTELRTNFVDLGMSPLCQTHIEPHELNHMERFYPLHAWVCEQCWLVQLEQYVAPGDIFSDYAYFSSYSDSWVEPVSYTHLRAHETVLDIVCRLLLEKKKNRTL